MTLLRDADDTLRTAWPPFRPPAAALAAAAAAAALRDALLLLGLGLMRRRLISSPRWKQGCEKPLNADVGEAEADASTVSSSWIVGSRVKLYSCRVGQHPQTDKPKGRDRR